MSRKKNNQPCIVDRIDCALEKMQRECMKPRAIYLLPDDLEELRAKCTQDWKKLTGSDGLLYPCSFKDVPLISEKLIPLVSVPVRATENTSVIYSTHGVGRAVPKRLPRV